VNLSRLAVVAALLLPSAAQAGAVVATCFTPGEECADLIVREIAGARRSVAVQAYSFTSAPIAEALAAAHRRGVEVVAVLDKSQRSERYSGATYLANAGIPVRIDARHAIAHNKVIVVDKRHTITGSYNFTKAAEEKNAENVVVIDGADIAARYLDNIKAHIEHSEPYEARNR
jgi:phosphatidylserine/phosphatidylglycerophosphate/cardiolipin synthase-like enzyme